MSTSSPFTRSGGTHRLIVTVVIGTAAAAVTANVVFNDRAFGPAVVERASTGMPFAPPGAQDLSVPSAAGALAHLADSPAEPAPTF